VKLIVPSLVEVMALMPERYICRVADNEPESEALDQLEPRHDESDDESLVIRAITTRFQQPIDLDRLLEGPQVEYSEGQRPAPPAEGFELRGRSHLVLHDPDQPFFHDLPAILLALPATPASPIYVDLRQLKRLELSVVRRIVMAMLLLESANRPVQLIVSDSQRSWFGEIRLNRLVTLKD
jgi:hypothetical protein